MFLSALQCHKVIVIGEYNCTRLFFPGWNFKSLKLSHKMSVFIVNVIGLFNIYAPGGETIDECGLKFLLAVRLHTFLSTSLPPAHRAQLLGQGIMRRHTSICTWIFFFIFFFNRCIILCLLQASPHVIMRGPFILRLKRSC